MTNVDARVAIVRRLAKCFICLRSGHISRNCSRQYRCNKCKKPHHISLCRNKATDEKDSASDTPSNEDDQTPTDKVSRTYHSSVGTDILLETAKASVSNDDNNEVKARLMFDSGSQFSYVSESLRSKLKLKALRQERLIINTFGNSETKLQTLDVVQLKVKNKFDNTHIYVEALCVPNICAPAQNQNVLQCVKKYEHLSNLLLADSSNGAYPLNIDILIGIDFYYSFISGRLIRGSDGPVALASSLGWILAGRSGLNKSFDSYFSSHSMRCSAVRAGDSVEDYLKDELGKPRVENRVAKVREVDSDNWFFVPGEQNPADIPTRPDDLSTFASSVWFDGPEFLRCDLVRPPEFNVGKSLGLSDVLAESKRSDVMKVKPDVVVCNLVLPVEFSSGEVYLDKVIDQNRYSSLQRLVRVTGYVIRFITNLKKKMRGLNDEIVTDDILTVEEYNVSAHLWIKEHQREIRNDKDFPKLKASLNLFDDPQGFLRLKGRYTHCERMNYEQKEIVYLVG